MLDFRITSNTTSRIITAAVRHGIEIAVMTSYEKTDENSERVDLMAIVVVEGVGVGDYFLKGHVPITTHRHFRPKH